MYTHPYYSISIDAAFNVSAGELLPSDAADPCRYLGGRLDEWRLQRTPERPEGVCASRNVLRSPCTDPDILWQRAMADATAEGVAVPFRLARSPLNQV